MRNAGQFDHTLQAMLEEYLATLDAENEDEHFKSERVNAKEVFEDFSKWLGVRVGELRSEVDALKEEIQGMYEVGSMPPDGYIAWDNWAEAQVKGGLKQIQCEGCKLYLFPQEIELHKCHPANHSPIPCPRCEGRRKVRSTSNSDVTCPLCKGRGFYR